MPHKVILSWSGGKDCAFALYELEKNARYDVRGLLTTINQNSNKISMHGTERNLLIKQTAGMGYFCDMLYMPAYASNETYNKHMLEKLSGYAEEGISYIAFADLYLEDIRRYRTRLVEQAGIKALFPLWKRNTSQLARDFINYGFKAVVTGIDITQLDKNFAGREFDTSFLEDLPAHVDPCGENGEFHTFVYDGPVFENSISVIKTGFGMESDRFYICDVKIIE